MLILYRRNNVNTIVKLMAAAICGLALTAYGSGGDVGNNSPTITYTVTPSVSGSGGTISPATPVSANSGATASFTLTPASGYTVASVGGTCGGTLNGNTYTTTEVISASCTVVATFTQTSTGASIANCFSAPNTVSYAMYSAAGYAGSQGTDAVTVGPATFNGQAAIKQSLFNNYWTVSSSGIVFLGKTNFDDTFYVADSPNVLPLNMQPNDFVDLWDYLDYGGTGGLARYTFVGFQTVTLGGKTFPNACHFRIWQIASDGTVDTNQFNEIDQTFASGYGMISRCSWSFIEQYAGDSSVAGSSASGLDPTICP
jgi:hypothetical protein